MFMLDLAVDLHKHISEIEAMPSHHLAEWMAYSTVRAERDATRAQALKAAAGARGRQQRALRK